MCQLHGTQQPADSRPAPSPLVPESVAAPRRQRSGRAEVASRGRRKLWDLPPKYHCPIIGTCLHVDELRRVARKAGASAGAPLSDYEVHVSFVAGANERRPLTVAAHKCLERKHASAVRRFSRARTPVELLALWREAVASGQIPGAFWALMTHPGTNAELEALAYEEVHMLSHQVGAGHIADAQKLQRLRAEHAALREASAEQIDRLRAELAEREGRIAALVARAARAEALESRLGEAQALIRALSEQGEAARLRERLSVLTRELADARDDAAAAAERAAAWRRRALDAESRVESRSRMLAELRAEAALLEHLMVSGSDACDHCSTGASCDRRVDLGGRRVLCIGGRSSLSAHYRTLVGRCNGELIHHDGGLEDGRARLDALLAAADVVVCPVDCVSHDASLRAKRYCKRQGKPCLFLERSGVASFARALERVAA